MTCEAYDTAHRRLCRRNVLDTWAALPHPKGAIAEQTVSGPQWVTWFSNRPSVLWVISFGQSFYTSTLYFGSVNYAASTPHRDRELGWIVDEVQGEDNEAIMLWTLNTVSFCFLLLAHCFSSFVRIPVAQDPYWVLCKIHIYTGLVETQATNFKWALSVSVQKNTTEQILEFLVWFCMKNILDPSVLSPV